MREVDWLLNKNSAEMMDFALGRPGAFYTGPGGIHPPRRLITNRQCRMFALACAGGPKDGGDWNKWAELPDDVDAPGLFSAMDGARYWVGFKTEQQHQHQVKPDERVRQAEYLRCVVGNPFQQMPKWANKPVAGVPGGTWGLYGRPSIITTTVLAIAGEAYDNHDWGLLPILADRLEDEGCCDDAILRHLRSQSRCPGFRNMEHAPSGSTGVPNCFGCDGTGWVPLRGPHVRGCHVVDLILGKE